jgi:hypothetical protein
LKSFIYFVFQSAFKNKITMTRSNYLTPQLLNSATIGKRALVGAGIAYVLITLFLFVPGVTTNPNWPKFWMVKPLIIVPLAGAVGGVFYHCMITFSKQFGWNKIIAIAVSLVVYIIGLWLGTVLGLNGTLWD